MGEPEKLTDVLAQEKVRRIVNNTEDPTLDADTIESIDSNENDGVTNRVGPMDPYDETEKLGLLAEGEPELEDCGSGTGKALIVRTQQDYPHGAVYSAVDFGLMHFLPLDLLPVALSEVDYILYIDYDYAINGTGVVTGTLVSEHVVTLLKVNCVLRVVNVKTGEELYRSAYQYGDNQYQLLFAMEDWVPSVNPNIGQAFAEAVAAIPR